MFKDSSTEKNDGGVFFLSERNMASLLLMVCNIHTLAPRIINVFILHAMHEYN